MFIAIIIICIVILVFYMFTGLLIAHLLHEDAPVVSAHRLVLNVLVWPALVLLFFIAWTVFCLDSLTITTHYRAVLRSKLRSVR